MSWRLARSRWRWPCAAAAALGGNAVSITGAGAADLAAAARFAGPLHQIRPPCTSAVGSRGASGALPGALHDASGCGIDSTGSGGGRGGGSLPRPQLVREFIWTSLYHATEGYFSKQTAAGMGVVGSLRAPLNFRRMAGQTAYLQAVQQQYQDLQTSWLTPVEIFQPHYGRAIAACILQHWRQLAQMEAGRQQAPPPLRIYEIGGGTGTLAKNILDWLQDEHPDAYNGCRYRCIEISPVLAELQQQKVAAEGGHGSRFAVRHHDAASAPAWAAADTEAAAGGGAADGCGGAGQEHAFIVMCEVLDNLPHDRVCFNSGSGSWQQTLVAASQPGQGAVQWQQQRQGGSGGGSFHEVLQPVCDPLIQRCLHALEAVQQHSGSRHGELAAAAAAAAAWAWARLVGSEADEVWWLPTGCLQLLDTLHQVRPSHTLVAADFDALPGVAVAGVNAPLVATTVGGTTIDHRTYLVPRGAADIFFPTDFQLLCQLYRHAGEAAQEQRSSTAAAASTAVAGGATAGQSRRAGGPAAARAEHLSTAEFMRRHSPDLAGTCTASGYNPLLEDYTNTAFFLGSTTAAARSAAAA